MSEMLRTRGSRVLILIAYLDFGHFPTLRLAFIPFLLLLNADFLTPGIWTLPGKRNSIATSIRSKPAEGALGNIVCVSSDPNDIPRLLDYSV